MLLCILFTCVLVTEVYSVESGKKEKPYMFPIPLELPKRNERSEQCWIRIEDVDLTETLTVVCYLAHAFLKSYIHDNNKKKMLEDDVNVSLWNEEPRSQQDILPKIESDPKTIKDWKTTTVLDPITRMRLYVSKKADCRLVIYTREGTSNYNVECEPFLYFMNDRLSGSAVLLHGRYYLSAVCVLLVLIRTKILLD